MVCPAASPSGPCGTVRQTGVERTLQKGQAADYARRTSIYVLSMAGQVAELEAYRSGARALAARILSAQEAERVRVSRELHDDTGQALTLILVRLQLIEQRTADEEIRGELQELRQLVVDTLDGVRRLAVQLGPSVLEDLGLASGLEWLVDRVREDTGLSITLRLDGDRDASVDPQVAVAVYRVAQEAITNVIRHANASHLAVRLDHTRHSVMLDVADDGHGFDVSAARARPARSVGLFGMAERIALVGGTIEITSRVRQGTRVHVRVPLHEGGPE